MKSITKNTDYKIIEILLKCYPKHCELYPNSNLFHFRNIIDFNLDKGRKFVPHSIDEIRSGVDVLKKEFERKNPDQAHEKFGYFLALYAVSVNYNGYIERIRPLG